MNLKPANWLDSCDHCASQEGRHYCLLHGQHMKNMDTVRCDDWEARAETNRLVSDDSAEFRLADESPSVAALFVEDGGSYFGLPHVDPWPESRDARLYAGPLPVVAHPPCQRWGKMWFGQPLTVKLTGVRKKKGDDGGCFAAALAAVRTWGGVLEHPWGSHAWAHFGLNKPPRSGGWIAAEWEGGWTCCVEQGRYGHYARKPTLLYAFGTALPELRWGHTEARLDHAVVARMGLKRAKRLGEVGARGGGTDSTPRIHTPIAFRDLLLGLAMSAQQKSRDAQCPAPCAPACGWPCPRRA